MGRNDRRPSQRPFFRQQDQHASQPGPGLVACITILQPWSHLIVTPEIELPEEFRPQKLVENRVWSTTHRGRLIICAGKDKRLVTDEVDSWLQLIYGCAVGEAELVACIDRRAGYGVPEPYAWVRHHRWAEEDAVNWVLANVRRFDCPVPIRGQQGLFYVPEATFSQAYYPRFVAGPAAARVGRSIDFQE